LNMRLLLASLITFGETNNMFDSIVTISYHV